MHKTGSVKRNENKSMEDKCVKEKSKINWVKWKQYNLNYCNQTAQNFLFLEWNNYSKKKTESTPYLSLLPEKFGYTNFLMKNKFDKIFKKC